MRQGPKGRVRRVARSAGLLCAVAFCSHAVGMPRKVARLWPSKKQVDPAASEAALRVISPSYRTAVLKKMGSVLAKGRPKGTPLPVKTP